MYWFLFRIYGYDRYVLVRAHTTDEAEAIIHRNLGGSWLLQNVYYHSIAECLRGASNVSLGDAVRAYDGTIVEVISEYSWQ